MCQGRDSATRSRSESSPARTVSGGEELANDLRTLGRSTIVGKRTGGGAHSRIGIRASAHLELAVPVARPTNPGADDNWEGVASPTSTFPLSRR
jgi:Zn-dependent M28 family amino/carboxypeptidase